MTITNYYIEDITTGKVLMNDNTWDWYIPSGNAKTFTSDANALTHIDTLSAGEYRIFSRIVKS